MSFTRVIIQCSWSHFFISGWLLIIILLGVIEDELQVTAILRSYLSVRRLRYTTHTFRSSSTERGN